MVKEPEYLTPTEYAIRCGAASRSTIYQREQRGELAIEYQPIPGKPGLLRRVIDVTKYPPAAPQIGAEPGRKRATRADKGKPRQPAPDA